MQRRENISLLPVPHPVHISTTLLNYKLGERTWVESETIWSYSSRNSCFISKEYSDMTDMTKQPPAPAGTVLPCSPFPLSFPCWAEKTDICCLYVTLTSLRGRDGRDGRGCSTAVTKEQEERMQTLGGWIQEKLRGRARGRTWGPVQK